MSGFIASLSMLLAAIAIWTGHYDSAAIFALIAVCTSLERIAVALTKADQ